MKKNLGAKTLAPAPVWVIGSYDDDGQPNVMTAGWVGIACSSPPCLLVSLQRTSRTYHNVLARQALTVNIPSALFAKETDYFGMAHGGDGVKLDNTALTASRSEHVDAPVLDEFPLSIECEVRQIHSLGLHTMFIVEIKNVQADESILGEYGLPDLQKLNPLFFMPGDLNYFTVGESLGMTYSLGAGFLNDEPLDEPFEETMEETPVPAETGEESFS